MGVQSELRNIVIMSIEERISELLSVMHETMNLLSENGLPDPIYSRAYCEWRILKQTSITLQEISVEEFQDDF